MPESYNYTGIDCAGCFFGLSDLVSDIFCLCFGISPLGSSSCAKPSQKSPLLANVHSCKRKPLQVNLFRSPVAFQPKHGKTTSSHFLTLRNNGWVLKMAPKPKSCPFPFWAWQPNNSGPQTILAERMATHRQDHLHPTEKNTRVVPPDMSTVTRDDMPSASFELILTVCLNAIALLKTKKKHPVSVTFQSCGFKESTKDLHGSSILNVNLMKCSWLFLDKAKSKSKIKVPG